MDLGFKIPEARNPEHEKMVEYHGVSGPMKPAVAGDTFAGNFHRSHNTMQEPQHRLVPVTTKRKVRRQVRRVMAEGKLSHQPGSVAEWQLVKWQLAHKLKLSPLRIVFLFSEASATSLAAKP